MQVLRLMTLLITVLIFCAQPLRANTERLESLAYDDPTLKELRSEIKKSMFIVKSSRNPETLPELKFYEYTVKEGDTFWTIMARSSQDIDTLITVNGIDNPSEIEPEQPLYIPNMRGIIYRVRSSDSLESISAKFKVKEEYIKQVNRIDALDKEFLFIPCGALSNKDRSVFLGSGFGRPLHEIHVTSPYGTRRDPFLGTPQFHSGIDLKCATGSDVFAVKAGRVIFAGTKGDYGKLVIIEHAGGLQTYYGHLSAFHVKRGDTVSSGSVIASSGSTGRSTGPHLHFEIRKDEACVNPTPYLRIKGRSSRAN